MYRHANMDIFLDPAVHGRGRRHRRRAHADPAPRARPGHHRLVIDPAADNVAAIRCYAKVGFRAGRRDAPVRAGPRRHLARRPPDGPRRRRPHPLTGPRRLVDACRSYELARTGAASADREAAAVGLAEHGAGAAGRDEQGGEVDRRALGRRRARRQHDGRRLGQHDLQRQPGRRAGQVERARRPPGRRRRSPPIWARGIISVSASTTGSWTTSPAGTATSQRRLSRCQRRGNSQRGGDGQERRRRRPSTHACAAHSSGAATTAPTHSAHDTTVAAR